jgi:hypothetical protein
VILIETVARLWHRRCHSFRAVMPAHWKVRASDATLRQALHGRIKRHHRFLLGLHLQQIDALEAAIAEIDREADAGLASSRNAVKQLSTIPGGEVRALTRSLRDQQ